ncbi:unnamed protein product [Blepharisma stoltei]|uniref:Uncharacterized protein n=1 Tax=Blepharisma stoltei TaxID=1481888 RepID=A0AAU9IC82_9CILI|nr:unnamed protein product [Blepharisma stoltei]
MILEFLRAENLFIKTKEFNVKDFCWMLKDEIFWKKTIEILKQRNYYFAEIWSFGIFHNDISIIRELMSMNKQISTELGRFFDSSIITTDKGDYIHLEYDPLINTRAHKLGKNPRIANIEFKNSYRAFLELLCEKGSLDISDQLCFVQYLAYQDRISEAKEIFGTIPLHPSTEKPGSSYLQIQYDYFCCYFDPEMLPIISALYENYPIESWRKLFNEAAKFSRETQDQDISILDPQEKEPTLMFSIEKDYISLQYKWVKACKIRFYRVDLEILFSKNPFFIGNSQHFKYVKPYFDIEINLQDDGEAKIKIPELLIGQNIVIEIDYGVYTVSKSHFSANLKFNLIERYGIIKIMNENLAPIAGAYIKVFVKQKIGDIKFYKDGYTDIKGKFDYVSLNVNKISEAERFAILVVDEELGSLVLEANPPPQ